MRRKDEFWLKDTNSWVPSSWPTNRHWLSLVPVWEVPFPGQELRKGQTVIWDLAASSKPWVQGTNQLKPKGRLCRQEASWFVSLCIGKVSVKSSDSKRYPSLCVILVLELPKTCLCLVKLSPGCKTMSACGQLPWLSWHVVTWSSQDSTPGLTSIRLSSQPRCKLAWMVHWVFICYL